MSRERGGADGGMSVATGPGMTGFRCDTWNEGAMLQCHGKCSLYVTSLICLRILKGPMHLGLSFLHAWVCRRSFVASHSPGR